MDKLTLIAEYTIGHRIQKTTFIKEGGNLNLEGALETLEDALRAFGFSFEGHLTIVEDE